MFHWDIWLTPRSYTRLTRPTYQSMRQIHSSNIVILLIITFFLVYSCYDKLAIDYTIKWRIFFLTWAGFFFNNLWISTMELEKFKSIQLRNDNHPSLPLTILLMVHFTYQHPLILKQSSFNVLNRSLEKSV